MKRPASPCLLSEPAIIAGIARAPLPESRTPREWCVDDYDRIRDTVAEALEGFDDFNHRVRRPLGSRIQQPARELVFQTPAERAEFFAAPLFDVVPPPGTLVLSTIRSHDQWNTDRASRLRTLVFMHSADMRERGVSKFDPVDITSTAKDGTRRHLRGYLAVPYDVPRGCAAGDMPEMNVSCAVGDCSPQSDQPLMSTSR